MEMTVKVVLICHYPARPDNLAFYFFISSSAVSAAIFP